MIILQHKVYINFEIFLKFNKYPQIIYAIKQMIKINILSQLLKKIKNNLLNNLKHCI